MNWKAVVLAGALSLVPTFAIASSVGVSGGLSRTPASDGYPGGGSTSAGVAGSYDLSSSLSFDGGLSLSRPKATPITEGPLAGKTREATVTSLSLGTTWTPGMSWNEDGNWSLSLGFAFSPKATELSSTTLTLDQEIAGKGTQTVDADALLKATSGAAGAALSIAYDTMGDSNWETAVDLSLSANRTATTQTIDTMVTAAGTTVTREKLLADCVASKPSQIKLKKTCTRMTPLLGVQEAAVVAVPISLSVDETIYQNTEVSLTGTYYWYDKNPNEVGYFTLASQGRPLPGTNQKTPSTSASFGTGVAIAPFAYSASLAAAQKLGPVRLSASLGRAVYLDDAGDNTSISVKAAWKITKQWRLSAGVATQNDVASDGEATRSYSGSAGLKYSF